MTLSGCIFLRNNIEHHYLNRRNEKGSKRRGWY